MERLVQLIQGDEPTVNPTEEDEFEATSGDIGKEPEKETLVGDEDDEDGRIEEV
jgi:hypothetical protein